MDDVDWAKKDGKFLYCHPSCLIISLVRMNLNSKCASTVIKKVSIIHVKLPATGPKPVAALFTGRIDTESAGRVRYGRYRSSFSFKDTKSPLPVNAK